MKKYTQRELINEISWSGVATGIGKGIGRAGLGLLRSISPTAGKLVDKLIKVDDNKTYGSPIDAVKATIKYLRKSGQIDAANLIDEIDATTYAKLKQRASGVTTAPTRLRTFDISQSKNTKYFLVSFGLSSPFAGDTRAIGTQFARLGMQRDKEGMLFTVTKEPSLNRLETSKWRVVKVEDATPALPTAGNEVNNTTPATKAAAAKPDPATTYLASRGVRKKIKTAS